MIAKPWLGGAGGSRVTAPRKGKALTALYTSQPSCPGRWGTSLDFWQVNDITRAFLLWLLCS